MTRFKWTPGNVSARNAKAMVVRTRIEQQQTRDVLSRVMHVQNAAELGSGSGRMTPVLKQVADYVVGFERERALVEVAGNIKGCMFLRVPRLTAVPAMDDEYGLVMTFTVLQHMSHVDARKVVDEAKRISSRYVLLVEDTDREHVYVDKNDETHFTLGRSVRSYQSWMAPWKLISLQRRQVEPGFSYQGQPRPYVGHYMLFELKDEGPE